MREELMILLVMAGFMIVSAVLTKNNLRWAVGFLLAAAALGSLVSGMGLRVREIVEGPFGFLDAGLAILSGMVFVRVLYDNGTMEKLLAVLAGSGKCGFCRALGLLAFLAIPGVITGTATASLVTAGALVLPFLTERGVPKAKAATFVTAGAFFGMVLPPVNLPAMIVCFGAGSVSPTPYVGFFLPLLILAVPSMVVYAALAKKTVAGDAKIENARGGFSLGFLPLILVLVLLVLDAFAASWFFLGYPVIFLIGTAAALLLPAKKAGGTGKERLFSRLATLRDGATALVPQVALMFALGAFIEVSSMTGVRGWYNTMILPYPQVAVLLAGMALSLVLGYFLSVPLPAFVMTYASFLIGWFGSPVMLAGLSTALSLVYLIAFRGGLAHDASLSLSVEDGGSRALIKALWVPALVMLVLGVALVAFGDSLAFLIV